MNRLCPKSIKYVQQDDERNGHPDGRIRIKRESIKRSRGNQELRFFKTFHKEEKSEQHKARRQVRFKRPARKHHVPRRNRKQKCCSQSKAFARESAHQEVNRRKRQEAHQKHRQANHPDMHPEERHKRNHQIRFESVHAGTPGSQVNRQAVAVRIRSVVQEREGVITRKSFVLVDIARHGAEHIDTSKRPQQQNCSKDKLRRRSRFQPSKNLVHYFLFVTMTFSQSAWS